ncbi:MAG: hypothetical protein AB8G86_26520 [Saprospiraceae bacterium]
MNISKRNLVNLSFLFLVLPLVSNAQSFSSESIALVADSPQSEIVTGNAAEIVNVSMMNLGVSHNQNTEALVGDTYTGLITVTFDETPILGTLRISGGTDYQFDFEEDNEGQTSFSFKLILPTNGNELELIVTYIGMDSSRFVYQSTEMTD